MIDNARLESTLRACLETDSPIETRLQSSVEEIARSFEAHTCTLHETDPSGEWLHLRAQIGLPPHILQITQTIPVGKGMAGICAERREPVTVCNLQSDGSGVARPAAKDTRVAGAIVVPVLDGDRVIATLGVGVPDDHEYSEEETRLLQSCGKLLAAALA